MRLAITGGASGIGAETVSMLQSAGHELLVFNLHEPGAEVAYIPLDLMKGDSIEAAIAQPTAHSTGWPSLPGYLRVMKILPPA